MLNQSLFLSLSAAPRRSQHTVVVDASRLGLDSQHRSAAFWELIKFRVCLNLLNLQVRKDANLKVWKDANLKSWATAPETVYHLSHVGDNGKTPKSLAKKREKRTETIKNGRILAVCSPFLLQIFEFCS